MNERAPVVVLPTYNEAENVPVIVPAILAADCRPDVLVVDDNSPDGTGDVVRRLQSATDRVQLLERRTKEGLGPAYLDGFARALELGYDVVAQMDADGSHDPRDLSTLVRALGEADLVIGSRYVDNGRIVGWTRGRRLLSRGGNVYASSLLRVGVHDLTGGFKAWRAELLRKVLDRDVGTRGYGFQIETTVIAASLGARIVEVPITFRDRTLGTSKMSARVASEALVAVPRLRRMRGRSRP